MGMKAWKKNGALNKIHYAEGDHVFQLRFQDNH